MAASEIVDPHLQQLILDRLAADEKLDDAVADFVLAACDGSQSLEAAIDGQSPERPEAAAPGGGAPEPPGAYVNSVTI